MKLFINIINIYLFFKYYSIRYYRDIIMMNNLLSQLPEDGMINLDSLPNILDTGIELEPQLVEGNEPEDQFYHTGAQEETPAYNQESSN